jgi:peroxiredoxin Q/BCP
MTRAAPKPGEIAPDFTLTADDGSAVTLSGYRGQPVVLYFYPKAMTGGCTAQACAFRDAHEDLAALGAAVLGVSPDAPGRLVRFREKEALNFPLLSDPDHAVADAYGVWGSKSMMGRAYQGVFRSVFVIDADGRVLAANQKVSPGGSVPFALAALAAGA